ncbi:agmatine deiminase family protein [Lacibacter sp. MH-610]|uniref:agmatine deiminase family protein n=1 Tax=Lacibacter sp. MH-610 TaxID=3020883 RepID=UPI003892B9D3
MACTSGKIKNYTVPSEFEKQEYIWLSWVESGFLGGEPFYTTIVQAIKEIHPYVKVKILYGPQLQYDSAQLHKKIIDALVKEKIDTGNVELFYNEKAFGAIQDPGPVFLRNQNGELAIADFKYNHPDKRSQQIDQNVAKQMSLPMISSSMVSEGGAWQTNGNGTMILVESVELDRNKKMNKKQIEDEYKKVLGVTKIIWLRNGLKEEEWGKMENGIYGIGTGGHIDEFCRFVNDTTILLAAIDVKDTVGNIVSKESFERMEHNFSILNHSKTADGKSLRIIRLPAGPLLTKKLLYGKLSNDEKSWFDDLSSDSVEFYLATGYMNFVIANEVVVTARFWKQGLPYEIRQRDEKAREILEKAFQGRMIVQIDCMPLHHDGAGLHCHSRNQPVKK